VSLAITHDPGQLPALICGIAALGGLLLSFMVRRRRVFVRARANGAANGATGDVPGDVRSTVQIGGLARTDASGGFEAEFASLAAELRSAHDQAAAKNALRERFTSCKVPAVVAGRVPAPIARAGPEGLHSRVGFA
jgi:cytochrome c biogenesis protein